MMVFYNRYYLKTFVFLKTKEIWGDTETEQSCVMSVFKLQREKFNFLVLAQSVLFGRNQNQWL